MPMAPRMAPRATPAGTSRTAIRHRDLAERQRPDDQRGGLRAGVAARAHDERDEEGEHDGPAQLALEVLHRGGGEHLAQEERAEPARPLPDHGAEADLGVRLVERLDTAQP